MVLTAERLLHIKNHSVHAGTDAGTDAQAYVAAKMAAMDGDQKVYMG